MTFADMIALTELDTAGQKAQIQKQHMEEETGRVVDKEKTEDIENLMKKIDAEIKKAQSKKKGFFQNLGIGGCLGDILDSDFFRGALSFLPGGRITASTIKGIESERQARHQKNALSNILADPKYKMLSGTYLAKPVSRYLSDVKDLRSDIDPTLSAIAGFGTEFGKQTFLKKGGEGLGELFKGGAPGAETFGVQDIFTKGKGPLHNLAANIGELIPEGGIKGLIENIDAADLKKLSGKGEDLMSFLAMLEDLEGQPMELDASQYFSGMNY